VGIDTLIIWLAFVVVILVIFYLVSFWYASTVAGVSPERIVGIVDYNLRTPKTESNRP